MELAGLARQAKNIKFENTRWSHSPLSAPWLCAPTKQNLEKLRLKTWPQEGTLPQSEGEGFGTQVRAFSSLAETRIAPYVVNE